MPPQKLLLHCQKVRQKSGFLRIKLTYSIFNATLIVATTLRKKSYLWRWIMKAVVSVIGKDQRGIISGVSTRLYEFAINVQDISQTIMQDYFTMIMLVDLSEANADFATISKSLSELGKELGVEIRIQNEQVFTSMHRI